MAVKPAGDKSATSTALKLSTSAKKGDNGRAKPQQSSVWTVVPYIKPPQPQPVRAHKLLAQAATINPNGDYDANKFYYDDLGDKRSVAITDIDGKKYIRYNGGYYDALIELKKQWRLVIVANDANQDAINSAVRTHGDGSILSIVMTVAEYQRFASGHSQSNAVNWNRVKDRFPAGNGIATRRYDINPTKIPAPVSSPTTPINLDGDYDANKFYYDDLGDKRSVAITDIDGKKYIRYNGGYYDALIELKKQWRLVIVANDANQDAINSAVRTHGDGSILSIVMTFAEYQRFASGHSQSNAVNWNRVKARFPDASNINNILNGTYRVVVYSIDPSKNQNSIIAPSLTNTSKPPPVVRQPATPPVTTAPVSQELAVLRGKIVELERLKASVNNLRQSSNTQHMKDIIEFIAKLKEAIEYKDSNRDKMTSGGHSIVALEGQLTTLIGFRKTVLEYYKVQIERYNALTKFLPQDPQGWYYDIMAEADADAAKRVAIFKEKIDFTKILKDVQTEAKILELFQRFSSNIEHNNGYYKVIMGYLLPLRWALWAKEKNKSPAQFLKRLKDNQIFKDAILGLKDKEDFENFMQKISDILSAKALPSHYDILERNLRLLHGFFQSENPVTIQDFQRQNSYQLNRTPFKAIIIERVKKAAPATTKPPVTPAQIPKAQPSSTKGGPSPATPPTDEVTPPLPTVRPLPPTPADETREAKDANAEFAKLDGYKVTITDRNKVAATRLEALVDFRDTLTKLAKIDASKFGEQRTTIIRKIGEYKVFLRTWSRKFALYLSRYDALYKMQDERKAFYFTTAVINNQRSRTRHFLQHLASDGSSKFKKQIGNIKTVNEFDRYLKIPEKHFPREYYLAVRRDLSPLRGFLRVLRNKKTILTQKVLQSWIAYTNKFLKNSPLKSIVVGQIRKLGNNLISANSFTMGSPKPRTTRQQPPARVAPNPAQPAIKPRPVPTPRPMERNTPVDGHGFQRPQIFSRQNVAKEMKVVLRSNENEKLEDKLISLTQEHIKRVVDSYCKTNTISPVGIVIEVKFEIKDGKITMDFLVSGNSEHSPSIATELANKVKPDFSSINLDNIEGSSFYKLKYDKK